MKKYLPAVFGELFPLLPFFACKNLDFSLHVPPLLSILFSVAIHSIWCLDSVVLLSNTQI